MHWLFINITPPLAVLHCMKMARALCVLFHRLDTVTHTMTGEVNRLERMAIHTDVTAGFSDGSSSAIGRRQTEGERYTTAQCSSAEGAEFRTWSG